MDFNNKSKIKDKESNRNKSKEKYINYGTNYLYNREKNKSFTSIINNKKPKKKDYFENFVKDMNNNKSNVNIINNKKPLIQNTNEQINDFAYIYSQLIDKENDSYQELKQKNKKLREIIIKVSKQLDLLSTKFENVKTTADNEKKMLLEKFDKISANYQMYAESYKKNEQLQKEKDILAENSTQLNIIYNSCKNSLINLIRKNMQYYKKLKFFYENKNNQYKSINIDEFVFSLKEEILNNLLQYKGQLDIINNPIFYDEYDSFINDEFNFYGFKRQNNHLKSKSFKRNSDEEKVKENNSFDECRKNKSKDKDKIKDKENISSRFKKMSVKKNILNRDKTPCKNASDLSCYKNIKNYNKTHFHNCFNEKFSNPKNESKFNNSNISKDNDNLFANVGSVIPFKKRYSSRK